MNDTEIELFALAVKLRMDYLECNPEVGMGPNIDMVVEWVCEQVGVSLSGLEESEIKGIVHSL